MTRRPAPLSRTASSTAVPRTVAGTALALVLGLSGCGQGQQANDNGPEPDPTQPAGITRTPAPVESLQTTVPLPGESNSPNVSAEVSAEASPSAG